ncbi:MAG: type II secretion system F family protein [Defluviitaleaceae bacterium]|nr:type II secretion system F family protein [Defluviitaleaceae bacterium]
MPNFSYEAIDLEGRAVSGQLDAPDEKSLISMLKRDSLYPVNISLKNSKNMGSILSYKFSGKLSMKVLSIFCTQMSVMMRVGIPITKVMDILSEQTENAELKKILESVVQNISKGESLSVAFSKFEKELPSFFINMIEAGETSGDLDNCLERAGIFFGRLAKLNSKVKNALIYPSFIVGAMIVLLILCFTWVLPAFANMYGENAELPAFTVALLAAGDVFREFWYIFAGVTFGSVIGFKFWVATPNGRESFDKFKFTVPAISKITKKVYAARFTRTFSSLISVGIAMPTALEVTGRSVLNKYMENKIGETINGVSEGHGLSSQLANMGLLPPLVVYMARLGEESGTMDQLLGQAADFFEMEAETAIDGLMTMIEPTLIITMALILLPILVAVLLPMFNMYDALLS